MKKIVFLLACMILFCSFGLAQTPELPRYIAPDDARNYDSQRFTTPTAPLSDLVVPKEPWPKINNISFDDKKNFNLSSNFGLHFTPTHNGMILDVNMEDVNLAIDDQYISTHGTSHTTAAIPFAYGVDVNGYSFFNDQIFLRTPADPFKPPITIINFDASSLYEDKTGWVLPGKYGTTFEAHNDANIDRSDIHFGSTNLDGSIWYEYLTLPKIGNLKLNKTTDVNGSLVSNNDLNAARFCFNGSDCFDNTGYVYLDQGTSKGEQTVFGGNLNFDYGISVQNGKGDALITTNSLCFTDGTCATTMPVAGIDTNWQTSLPLLKIYLDGNYVRKNGDANLNDLNARIFGVGTPANRAVFATGTSGATIQTIPAVTGTIATLANTSQSFLGITSFAHSSGLSIPNGTTAGKNFTSSVATGTAPYTCTSTTTMTNCSAATLTGIAIGTSGNTIPKNNTINTFSATQLTDSIHDFNSGRIVRANAGFNFNGTNGYTGTIPYLISALVTCHMDINGGIITAISGAGCP